jgi:hypothetical protein
VGRALVVSAWSEERAAMIDSGEPQAHLEVPPPAADRGHPASDEAGLPAGEGMVGRLAPALDALSDELARHTTALRRRAKQVEALAARASAAEQRCEELARGQEVRDREIAGLREQVEAGQARLEEIRRGGEQRLSEIQRLSEEFGERAAAAERDRNLLRGRVGELTEHIAERDRSIAELRGELRARDDRVAALAQCAEAGERERDVLRDYVSGFEEVVGRQLGELRRLGEDYGHHLDGGPPPDDDPTLQLPTSTAPDGEDAYQRRPWAARLLKMRPAGQ